MYNSKYYTCEQIDQRLLQGYFDDAVEAGYTGTKAQYLAGLLKSINYSANPNLVAEKVIYDPSVSGLSSKNVKAALDELARKFSGASTAIEELNTKNKTQDTEIAKKVDKTSIVQEFGDSKDKVLSQFALPFREIESLEFIHCIVDSDNHLLFGIQQDGSIEWGKGIPTPIKYKFQEIVNQCQQDKVYLSETINTINSILDKTTIHNEAGEIQNSPFRVIENDEFLCAIVDAKDNILFGISKETGKPYYPLNDMYHVEQNKEYFSVWLDAENHVLLGISRDGQIIGEIHAVNALKEVVIQLQSAVASLQPLQEKVADIDSSLKEFLDVFSLNENPEYLSVETDVDGKILASTNADGSHYIHNVKSETIPEEFWHIEDHEGRMEITIDSDERVMSYRDSNGKKHEHDMEITNLEVSNLNLQGNSVNNIQDALKSNGFNVKTPIDWSESPKVELPMPVSCAILNLTTDKQAESKGSNIHCFMEFWDCNGNYFKKPILLNAQGSSSMGYSIKNQAIDINDGSKIKFGNWCYMDSFHIKKYYIDVFRGQCVAQYWLTEQTYMTRPFGQRRPYDYLNHISVVNNGNGAFDKDFWSGALCHPDGFPCHLFFNGKDAGVYAFNLKKDRANYNCKKDNAKNIILDGVLGSVFWTANGDLNKKGDSLTTVWQDFEVRNPKIKKDINGNDYNGDAPTEPSSDYSETKGYIEELTKIIPSIKAAGTDEEKKTIFESAFNLPFLIDYDILSQVDYNYDGYRKNWIWCCWDGKLWTPTRYDLDSVFGQHWNGASYIESSINTILGDSDNLPTYYLHNLYKSEESARYAELRNKGILTIENIVGNLEKWVNMCGYDNLKNDIEKIVVDTAKGADYTEARTVPCTPSYRDGSLIYSKSPTTGGWYNSLERVRNWVEKRLETLDTYFNYNK